MATFKLPKRKQVLGSTRLKSNVTAGYGINQFSTYSLDHSGFDSSFEGILPRDEIGKNDLYRRIYQYDSVSGAAVDLMAMLPFSELSLAGVDDPTILQVYRDTIEHLNIQTLVPLMATEYLIIGKLIGTLVFNDTLGIFTDIIIQDPDYATIEPIPLQGYDPKIDLRVPPDYRKFLTSTDPRDQSAKSELSDELARQLLSGKVALDPMTTLYLSRKTFPKDTGTSFLSRVVPFYILEQLLLAGTITGAQRRQRSILHLTLGSDTWEPSPEQFDETMDLFAAADLDPTGAIVATRRDVEANEIRQGGDFWKVTDEWDSLTQAKMRSLGINESFLCNKINGIVSTEKGLLKIQNIYPEWKTLNKNEYVPIDLKVKGFPLRPVTANKFWYRGYGHTYQVTTERGYNLDTTEDHRFLVLGSELKPTWKRAKELTENDFLFIDTRGVNIQNDKPLKLNLTTITPHPEENNQDPKKPSEMTEDFAYLIGLILSDGSIRNNTLRFSNSMEIVVDAFEEKAKTIFGSHNHMRRDFQDTKGDTYEIQGISGTRKENYYSVSFCSSIIIDWLRQLEVRSEKADEYSADMREKYAWRFEEIPWCIMQAPRKCQYAFLAGFIDGDGSVQDTGEIVIYRFSHKIRTQLMVLLADLGYPSFTMVDHPNSVRLSSTHGSRLYNHISAYIHHPLKTYMSLEDSGYHRTLGIPVEPLREFLKSRHMYRKQNVGEYFENDIGEPVLIRAFASRFSRFLGNVVGEQKQENGKLLLYSSYKEDKYSELIEEITHISSSVGKRLKSLLELNYKFDRFSHKIKMPKDHLFDLSISQDFSPAYVANAFVTHNTGDATYNCATGDTLFETRKGMVELGEIAHKLGINESDNKEQVVTFNDEVKGVNGWEKNSKIVYQGLAPCKRITTESGYSEICTLNHPILTLRDELMLIPSQHLLEGDRIVVSKNINNFSSQPVTSRIQSIKDMGLQPVYDLSMEKGTSHIFVGNGIYQRQTMEAALSVFIEQLRSFRFFLTQKIFYHKLFPILARVHRFVKRKQSELNHNIRITGAAKDIPLKDLIMPEVQWHKQLAPSYDESYFSILSSVQEQGLPIPLRVWAAAGGFSIEKLLDGLDDDLEVRKRLGEYKQKMKELPGAEEEEESGWGSVGDSALKKRKKLEKQETFGDIGKRLNEKTTKRAEYLLKTMGNKENLPASKILIGNYD